MKQRKLLSVLVLLMLFMAFPSVEGATGYTYSHRNEPIYSTVGLDYSRILTFDRLGLQSADFTRPESLYIYEDKVYVVDSMSNKLFVFNTSFVLQETVEQFMVRDELFTEEQVALMNTRVGTSAGKLDYATIQADGVAPILLNGVSGVYRSGDSIYIADKGNSQILIVDATDYHVKQVVSTPDDITFANRTFRPSQVVTDAADRIYVVADEVYEGIIEIDASGEFNRFVGVNYVTLSVWDIFWRTISTEAQLARSQSIISTSFTSLAIDARGFIYATSLATTDENSVVTNDEAMIKKINPSGIDVLRRNGYSPPKGDLDYIRTGIDLTVRGPSRFSAIAVNDYGLYTAVDAKNGRLFTYDMEGNLLYISGGSGTQLNALQVPVSIQYLGEEVVVLDRQKRSIIVFQPTQIATIINKASEYFYQGMLVESAKEWEKVVEINSNYEYAYVGIGKNLLEEGRYEEAMENFRIGFNRDYYSRAYKMYRDERIKKYFAPVMTGGIVLLVGGIVLSTIQKRRKASQEEVGEES